MTQVESNALVQNDSQAGTQAKDDVWRTTATEAYRESAPSQLTQSGTIAPSEVPAAAVEEDGSIDFAGVWGDIGLQPQHGPDTDGDTNSDTDKTGGRNRPDDGGNPDEGGNPDDHARGKEEAGKEKQEKQLPVPPEYTALAEQQQLQVKAVAAADGHIEYVYYAELGERQVEVLRTDKPPEQAETQLKDAQEKLIEHIESQYNVRIARDGETVQSLKRDREIPITTPTLGELIALDQGLMRSAPDTETANGEPLRIYIADKGQDIGALGFHRDGEIALNYQDNLGYLQEVSIHELAHVGQSELFTAPGAEERYAEQLGWVKGDGDDEWLLRGKNNTYWKKLDDDKDTWVQTDSNGNPVDANGNRIDNPWNPFDHGEDSDRAQKKTPEEMREIAVVKPYSTYFDNPVEMGAALITPFRDGRELREKLYHESPQSYDLAKQMDQQQINDEFGVQPDGQPKLIRNPDGILVDNTPAHRQEIAEFEAKF